VSSPSISEIKKSEKSEKRGQATFFTKMGPGPIFLEIRAYPRECHEEKTRENIFSQCQGLIPASEKVACPLLCNGRRK